MAGDICETSSFSVNDDWKEPHSTSSVSKETSDNDNLKIQCTDCKPSSLSSSSKMILDNPNNVNKNEDLVIPSDSEVTQNESENEQCSLSTGDCFNKTPNSKQSDGIKDSPSPSQPSKQRLCSTKRRAGLLYKQIKSSKVSKVSSKYFNQAHKSQDRWVPPRSPYALVQEDLFDNPWQLLVATIFLTKTAAKRALPQLHKFLTRFPRPEDVLQANYEDIDEYFKPLGLTNTRSHIIMRFTVEFLEKDWTYPRELYGIGKYGDDSYRIFCINEWRQVSPDDIPLTMYRNWLLEHAERLGIH